MMLSSTVWFRSFVRRERVETCVFERRRRVATNVASTEARCDLLLSNDKKKKIHLHHDALRAKCAATSVRLHASISSSAMFLVSPQSNSRLA